MGAVAFLPQELQRFRQVQEESASLQAQQVVANLANSSGAVRQLTESLNAQKQQLQAIIQAEQKENKLLDKYNNHYGCQAFFFGQRRKQEKITQHNELLKKYEAQHADGAQRLNNTEQSLHTAQRDQAMWQGKVSQLQCLEAERSSLISMMFSRPPWTGDPVLAPMVSEAASLASQAASAQGTAQIYHTAGDKLRSALDMCNQAVALLQQAGWLGQFEIGMDFGTMMFDPMYGLERRGGFAEFIEMMEISQAQEMVQGAGQQINAARAILPTIPFIEKAIVHDAMAGIFADILMGNMMSEMIIIQQVHSSMRRVGVMMQQVQQSRSWCKSNQAAFEGQHSSLAAAAGAKNAEVERFKTQQLQAALAGQVQV